MKINGTDYEGIRIYKDGEILFKTDRGYLEMRKFENGKVESFYRDRIDSFKLKNDIKRANKLNLNRKDNFYIVEEIPYHYPSRVTVLYIHADEIGVEYLGEQKAFVTTDETNYMDTYKLTFKSGFRYTTMEYREVPNDYEFANKKEKENYVHVDSGKNAGKHFIREYVPVESVECIVTSDCYTRTEYSDFRLKAQELSEEFKKILPNGNISYYDIEKLMKVFNIEKKEA